MSAASESRAGSLPIWTRIASVSHLVKVAAFYMLQSRSPVIAAIRFKVSLGDALYSSTFVHFPPSGKRWAYKIHTMLPEQPANLIHSQDLMHIRPFKLA